MNESLDISEEQIFSADQDSENSPEIWFMIGSVYGINVGMIPEGFWAKRVFYVKTNPFGFGVLKDNYYFDFWDNNIYPGDAKWFFQNDFICVVLNAKL